MTIDDHDLAPATLLRGHVSQDTAYLVDDYPYGRRLRCKIRYWLHTADTGQAKGYVRLMSQTTNPKATGEPWNNPRRSTYATWALLYLDNREHVEWWPFQWAGPTPWDHLLFQLRGLPDQLTGEERQRYDRLVCRSATSSPEMWAHAKSALSAIARGAPADHLEADHNIYLSERSYRIATAALAAGVTL